MWQIYFDKYKHSGYGIGFDARGSFSLSDGSGFGKNVIMFDAVLSSSMHVNNRRNYWYMYSALSRQYYID